MFYTSLTKTWYADDIGEVGTFKGIQCHLEDLMIRGPPRGYFPEPTKRILVVYPQNVPRAEAFFWGYGLYIVKGRRYLRGFVGKETAQTRLREEKVTGWR